MDLSVFGFFGDGQTVFVVGLEGPGEELFRHLTHGGAKLADLELGVVVLPQLRRGEGLQAVG